MAEIKLGRVISEKELLQMLGMEPNKKKEEAPVVTPVAPTEEVKEKVKIVLPHNFAETKEGKTRAEAEAKAKAEMKAREYKTHWYIIKSIVRLNNGRHFRCRYENGNHDVIELVYPTLSYINDVYNDRFSVNQGQWLKTDTIERWKKKEAAQKAAHKEVA